MNPDADTPALPIPTAPATDDGEGAGPIPAESSLAATIQNASDIAVDQHLADQPPPKRAHGQRGPDKRPRKRRETDAVPVESMGNGAPSPLLAEGTPRPLEPEWQDSPPIAPPFDEKMAGAALDLFVRGVNKVCGGVVRAVTLHHTHDPAAAEVAAKAAEMDQEYADAVKTGGIEWCRQQAVSFKRLPAFMFFGGLGAHAFGVAAQIRGITSGAAVPGKKEATP